MYKTLQRTVAFVLLICSLVTAAISASLPSFVDKDAALNANRYMAAQWPFFKSYNNYPPVNIPANLTLTSEQLGLSGPFNLGVNYSNLTGAYVTAQYIQQMSDTWAYGLLGEYGPGQYRINGTLGFRVFDLGLFKVSAERFNQRLPFIFDSGMVYERVNQDAVGARYQRFFPQNRIFQAFDTGGYYANAHNVRLAQVTYWSDGLNCLGNPAGVSCINERNIAGGISLGGDIGFSALLTPRTLMQARLNYDELYYNTIYSLHSQYNRSGFGTTLNFEQILTPQLRLSAGAEFRSIYDSFNVAVSWLAPLIHTAQTEFTLFAQRIVSKNPTPDNDILGLRLSFLGDLGHLKEKDYQINPGAFLYDLRTWVRDPAVRMNQVLAIAEQVVRLVGPRIQGIIPNSGPLGGGNVIALYGSNFMPNATVLIDDQVALVQYISSTQLSITIPPAIAEVLSQVQATNSPFAVTVLVQNPDGQQATLNESYFYTTDLVGPFRMHNVIPNQGSTNGNTLITISGQNLNGVGAVAIGGVAAQIINNSATELQVLTPAHAAGVASIAVAAPTGTYTLANAFTYAANIPVITSISPTLGSVNGLTTTTIQGSNLGSIRGVYFGSTPATRFNIQDDNHLIAVTPTYSVGPLTLNIMGTDGNSNSTLMNAFTYQFGSPLLSTISPNTGSVAGGITLNLQGRGFSPTTTVMIGNVSATNVIVTSPTSLTLTLPAYVSGPLIKDVIINNGEGSFTLIGGFTYTISAPTLANLTPNSGSLMGGTTVTLSGSGFVPGTTVAFGGIAATNVQVLSGTTLTAVVPAHTNGVVDVVVDNGIGTATLTGGYTYVSNTLTLSGISPSTGGLSGGIAITLTGTNLTSTNLTGVNSVSVGGVAATSVVVVNDTSVTAVVPAYVSGPLVSDVIVSNGRTNATLIGGFTYQASAPSITSISPTSGRLAGGVSASILGGNFIPGATVTIGGIVATNVNVVNATTIDFTIPAYVNGSFVKDVVVNNGIGNATLAGGFTYTVNAPTLNGISPMTGSISGGTLVTLSGSGFTPTTTVTIGGVAATNITVTNTTTLKAVVPAYVSGSLIKDVVVNNGVSNATLSGAFTYQAIAPTLVNISPNAGSVTGGTVVTVQGSGFIPGTTLSIGGILASNVQITNATTLTATIPAYVRGSLVKDVIVNNGMSNATLAGGFTYTESAPTLSQITPATGSVAGGTMITLTGTGFNPSTTVTVGGVAATSVVVSNSTTITAITPAYTGGALTVDVVVDNGISNATLIAGFTYTPMAVTIASITPALGSIIGGTPVIITGTGFTLSTVVFLGGYLATDIVMLNANTIAALTPPYVSGSLIVDVMVTNNGSNATLAGGFTYVADNPTIASIIPNMGTVDGGTSLTITGTNFTPGTNLTIGGSVSNVNVLNAATLIATTPAYISGSLHKDVTIDNGVGVTTLLDSFTYLANAPTLTNSSPATGSAAGGTIVTLTGTHFTPNTIVTFGGIPAANVTVNSATSLTTVSPAYVDGSLTVNIEVDNGVSNAVLINAFTYQPDNPTILSMTPNTGPVSGGTAVLITGSNFTPSTTVTIGGVAASNIHFVNSTLLTATIPAYVNGSLNADVVVDNGVASAALVGGFTYVAIAPTLISVLPNTGDPSGGTTITLTGTGFSPGTTVTIGGIPATNVNILNSTSLTAVTPAHASGLVDVQVNNGVSSVTLSNAFNYVVGSLTLSGISPGTGSVAGGTSITLTGTNLSAVIGVLVGGIPATNVTVVNSNSLTATVPAYLSGALTVDVIASNGIANAVLVGGFTYTAAIPTISTILPNTGSVAGNTTITINGTNFDPSTTVTIGGIATIGVNVINSTTLTLKTPAYVSGSLVKNVVVTNSAGTATAIGGFTYTATTPTLSNVSPNTGSVDGGTSITMTGTGFTPATIVAIGGLPATGIVVNSATSLTAITPAYVSGSLNADVVLNNGVSNAVLSGGFTYQEATPTISTIISNTGSMAGGTFVTVSGTHFTPTTILTIGGVTATGIHIVNETTLTATVPAYVSGSMTVDVVVTNGAGSATLTGGYTYLPIVPVLTNITPKTGPMAGGTTITLTGTGFTPTTTVSIGGVLATSITIQNATTLTAVTPAYLSGPLAANVIVNNGFSSGTLLGAFMYQASVPTLNTLTPNTGSVLGGTSIIVSGNGFTPTTTVTIGGIAVSSVNVTDTHTLTIITPSYVAGSLVKDVVVNNGVGSITLTGGFTYTENAPTLLSVLPNIGSTQGGTIVNLIGTNFTPTTTVSFGGISATNVTVNSAISITAVVPAYVSGSLITDVTVTNIAGSATLAGGFTYTSTAPTLLTVTPSTGSVSGGITVNLTGTGFTPSTTVTFGGVAATSVTFNNSASLTAVVPAYVSGSLSANVVVNNGVSNAVLTGGFTYIPITPTINTITPNNGSIAGGTAVTVSGANFTPSTTLTIDGIAATSINVVNATTLTAVIPAYVSGSLVKNVVVNNGVGSATLNNGYTYIAIAPTLNNVNPSSGSTAGGTIITLTGTGFVPSTTVSVGGVAATGIVIANATSLTAVVPAYVSGSLTKDISVNNGVASATLAGVFTYNPSTPTLLNVSPNSGSTLGGTSVTLTGTNFTPTTTVTIGGIAATNVNVVNAMTLTATTPTYVNGSLIVDVSINNGVNTATLISGFTYTASAPTLSNASPNTGSVAGGTTITLTGTGFLPGTTVTVGGVAATGVVINNTTSLTAIVPAYVSGALAADIVVNNGISNAVLSGGFTYQPAAPTIVSVTPHLGSTAGGTTITVSGTNFTPTTTLTIGGIAATNINILNATTLTATTPAYVSGSLAKNVVVSNSVSSATLTSGYTYVASVPSLIGVSPNSGSINGGTTITLTGTDFTPGTTVTIGGVAATSINVVNATTLTAITPAYVSGLLIKDIVINNGVGSATLLAGYTYVAVSPTVTGVSPSTGPITGSTLVTISGSGFTPTTTVTIGGISATSINITSATSLTAITPAYISGSLSANVVVTNEVASATLNAGFTYQAIAPTLLTILPNIGSINGGTSVTLTGTGFIPTTTVTLGGIAASNVTVDNVTTLTATTPAYASGSLIKDVTVTNTAGSATLTGGFTYSAIAPTLSNISPNIGPVAGGTTITLTGTGFTPSTTVQIAGIAATGITVNSATSLTAVVPAYVSGSLSANVVVNNGVSNAVLSGGFTYQAAAPTISTITPNSGSMVGGTSVTVNGTNFTPSTILTIGGIAATSVNVTNATSLTALIPTYVSGSLVKDVVVSNSVNSATLSNGYTYTTVAPTLSNVSPASGTIAGGTTITLTGTGFTPATTVTVGGIAATSVVVSNAGSLTAVIPAYVSGSLTKDITVNNGNANATLTGGFTYTATTPTLVSITPSSGSTSGGTSVTLSGTAFVPGTTITIGGVSATNITVVNATTLTATTPAYVSGSLTQTVVVNNGVGTASLLNAFTYVAGSPTLVSISPNTGSSSGGTSVTLTGTNFIPGSSVTIGGQSTTSTTVVNASTITAVTPAYISGSLGVNVVVNNTVSTATLTNGYTYVAVAPQLSSCSYPGGLLTVAWACVGTNMNAFPNTYLNVQGGLFCSVSIGISSLIPTLLNATNIGANSLLPGLLAGCKVQLCNNSTCTGLTSNVVSF